MHSSVVNKETHFSSLIIEHQRLQYFSSSTFAVFNKKDVHVCVLYKRQIKIIFCF